MTALPQSATAIDRRFYRFWTPLVVVATTALIGFMEGNL